MDREERINKGIDYIIQHLDEEISVDDVASHVHYSKYHFCRVFKEVTGESVYALIKRLKIDQSAVSIKLEKDKTITDIGLDYGYSSSNYSSVFKMRHHVAPAEFRKSANTDNASNPFTPEIIAGFGTYDDYAGKIRIEEMPEKTVIYERMIGNYAELAERWVRFMDTYKTFIKSETLMIERFYHDPVITNVDQCICDLCITTDSECEAENRTFIKGGRFATYRFEGQIADIFCVVQGIFRIWLPQSGYKMAENYALNIYRKIDLAHSCVVMDLCIPIK